MKAGGEQGGYSGGWRDMAEEGRFFVGILWLKLLTNHGEERKHLTNQSETNSKKSPLFGYLLSFYQHSLAGET